MVEVVYRPIKRLIVYECIKYKKPDELARAVSMESGTIKAAYLKWAEGIVFRASSLGLMLSSDIFAREFMEGKFHVSVEYSPMPEFRPRIQTSEERVIVPIIDDSNNELSLSLVGWIKEREGKAGSA